MAGKYFEFCVVCRRKILVLYGKIIFAVSHVLHSLILFDN